VSAHESLNLLKGYLGAAQYSKEEAVPRSAQPFVTLSRQTGAGGISIGTHLRERLRAEDREASSPWLWFDRELLGKVIEQHSLPRELAHAMDHTQYNRMLKWVDELAGHETTWSDVAKKINETIMHLAQLGNVILVGRGSHLLTRPLPGGVHVRLIGSLSRRVTHAAEYYHLTRREAEGFIKREDVGRRLYVKDHFGIDIDDALHYDLVINTDHVPYDDAVDIVVSQVQRRRRELARLRG